MRWLFSTTCETFWHVHLTSDCLMQLVLAVCVNHHHNWMLHITLYINIKVFWIMDLNNLQRTPLGCRDDFQFTLHHDAWFSIFHKRNHLCLCMRGIMSWDHLEQSPETNQQITLRIHSLSHSLLVTCRNIGQYQACFMEGWFTTMYKTCWCLIG